MARKSRVDVNTSMTDAQRRQHEKDQARERERRGLVSFTRPQRYEEVFGRQPGESGLGSAQRRSQIDRRTRRK